ncbi:Autophagy-related protein 20 [Podosphaera aphanis]|nr:Autophagy-related protein 20 [Podosphaera aphanis]
MWNDEDNNPYGTSFEQDITAPPGALYPPRPRVQHSSNSPRSSAVDDNHNSDIHTRAQYNADYTDSDNDDDKVVPVAHRSKKGSYNSRIEQILHENPDLPILIVDAGKSLEGGKVYYSPSQDLEVRRRYSEFASLRDALSRLHPTLVMPPIPEKHTMADYAANPTKAKQDQQIIDLRKRMLAVFLNRCRIMDDVRDDGVWWRFLDPNSSWNEVIHSHPIASIPKSIMKAPPLDPANPSPAHAFLPIPASSARLKAASNTTVNSQGMPISPTDSITSPLSINQKILGSQSIARFPIDSSTMTETELDPYFIKFESSSKELELLLTGPLEKINRRTLNHLSSLSLDFAELGARFNGFALSEASNSLAAAIERVGQAIDTSYLATEELSSSLGAIFAEPMRESAQFAGVVRGILRYRVLKRVQQEMTNDELAKKRALLESLERSETEAKRIENYIHSTSNFPRRSVSSATDRSPRRESVADTASIDSDFPPTHGDISPSVGQGVSPAEAQPLTHRKTSSGSFIANKIFVRISHAVHGVVDVDPERTRRDLIGKTKETISQLEQAQQVVEQDVKDASQGILKDLKRFQAEKEDDLRRYMLSYAKSQIEWARKNKETWEEAKSEISKIDEN